jgi:hypothetical protein
MRRLKKGCPGLIIAFRAMELFIIFPYFLARMRTMVKKYICARIGLRTPPYYPYAVSMAKLWVEGVAAP